MIAEIFDQLKVINRKSKKEVRLVMIPAGLGNQCTLILFKNGELKVEIIDASGQ